MRKNYLKQTWINPSLYKAKSIIDGFGVFAKKDICEGTKIMEWGGVVVEKDKFDGSEYRIQSAVPIDENYYLATSQNGGTEEVDEYLNHSCEPNSWLVDEVTVVARRDIKKGEEITLDCATWDCDANWLYVGNGKCVCKSPNCRKDLSPNDYMKPELQKRYKNHFSPYIQKRIEKTSER